ncbi:MAG TPA: FAD-binding oxidoreductase, partial [Methylocystis sp.]|nr:FAD-binding oxidoreductase [Methylocystis sp.]
MSNSKLSPAEALERLRQLLGERGFIADAQAMAPYLLEERGSYQGAARAVLRPASTAEVAEIVKLCAAAEIPIFPQGGNTGLSGGAVPWEDGKGVVLSLGRMNKVRLIDPIDYSITVEAGCILAEVQKAAEAVDRLFPLSLGAEGSCQIGGNISTNAGGIAVLRYGNMRSLVLGLEVVLPDGRIWHGLRALRKDNTGYDLKQLFIGGEGTLGIVTAATLRLFPLPKGIETAFLGLTRVEDAMELFSRARMASGDQLTAFELISRFGIDMAQKHVPGIIDPLATKFPWYVLVEMSSSEAQSGLKDTLEQFLSEVMEKGLVKDGVIATSSAQAKDLWRIREGLVEAQKHEGGSIKHDISVPVSKVANFILDANK